MWLKFHQNKKIVHLFKNSRLPTLNTQNTFTLVFFFSIPYDESVAISQSILANSRMSSKKKSRILALLMTTKTNIMMVKIIWS